MKKLYKEDLEELKMAELFCKKMKSLGFSEEDSFLIARD